MKKFYCCCAMTFVVFTSIAQVNSKLQTKINEEAKQVEEKVIAWRRDFHQYPEMSNMEFKTGKKIADMLAKMGLDVQYPVAKTGVVAILRGGKPGPVVALRADMDALPVTERNSLPFASKEKTVTGGTETGIMHACGHDGHMAILLGVADILSRNKSDLKGTVKFIFQPAEEGVTEEAGAALMIKEGVLQNPTVDAIFGLHLQALLPSGQLAYRPVRLTAAVDGVDITVRGVGAHGATPWESVDPIVVSSQIIAGLQTIVSREMELTNSAAVLTIGSIHAGVRRNIIPETASMEGTIRTFDVGMQKKLHEHIIEKATKIAESAGANVDVKIKIMYPATINDPALTERMVPSLIHAAGKEQVVLTHAVTMAEDFSFFQQKVPGMFFFLGAYPTSKPERQPVHHTSDFMIDEKALLTGVKAFLNLTYDYMESARKQ